MFDPPVLRFERDHGTIVSRQHLLNVGGHSFELDLVVERGPVGDIDFALSEIPEQGDDLMGDAWEVDKNVPRLVYEFCFRMSAPSAQWEQHRCDVGANILI